MRLQIRGFVLGCLLLTTVLAAKPAKASLMIEPYLGYGVGAYSNQPTSGSSEQKHQLSGVVYGGRLGLSIPFFFIALDYGLMNGTSTDYGLDGTAIQNQLGAVLGLKLPFFRFYAGYAFMNDLKIQATGGDVTFGGSAVKGGVGFTGLPFLSLNLEYISNTYTSYKAPGVDQSISGTTFSSSKGDFIVLSVSLPFDI